MKTILPKISKLFLVLLLLVGFMSLAPKAHAELRDLSITYSNTGLSAWYGQGYRFTPVADGNITKLWCRNGATSGSVTVRLWNDTSPGTLLASANITCNSTTWVSANITPVAVTAGTYYRVDGPDNYQGNLSGTNITTNNITINQGYVTAFGSPTSWPNSANSTIVSPYDVTVVPSAPSAPTANAASNITQTSFSANWSSSAGATSYNLDVSTNVSFTSFVTGYNNLNVGNVTTYSVTGLSASTTYYYRVSATNGSGTSVESGTISLTTASPPGGGDVGSTAPTPLLGNYGTTYDMGYKFTANKTGQITQLWCYSNTTQNVYLWDATGSTILASATGVNCNGVWTAADIAPVNVTSGTSYIVTTWGNNYYMAVTQSGTYRNITLVNGVYGTAGGVAPTNSNGNPTNNWSSNAGMADVTLGPTASAGTNITTSSFSANWSAFTGAASYELDVSTASDFSSFVGSYNALNVGNVTTYSVTGLSPITTYYYRVRAVISGVDSGNSAKISVTTAASVPSAPTSSAATNITSTSFSANWSVPTGSPTGYKIDVATDNGFTSFVTGYNNLDVPGGSTITQSVTGLTAGSTYYYRVRGYNGNGTGSNSSTITAVTLPSAPTATAGTNLATTSFSANWGSVTGATSYSLDVSTVSNFTSFVGSYNGLNVGNVTTYSVTGLSGATTYYYRVNASTAGGAGADSNTITVLTVPAAPTSSAATSNTTTSFSANWGAVSGASSYNLDVNTASGFNGTAILNNQSVATTTYSVTGLTAGTTYYYRVSSTNASGTSAESGTITTAAIPNATTATSATNNATTSFSANWNSASGATGYKLDVSTDNFSTYVGSYQNLDVGNVTTYSVTGLGSGVAYSYRVAAYNVGGTGAESNAISVTTQLPPCGLPTTGNYTLTQSCSISNQYDGVDAGSGTTNTAVLTVPNGTSFTVGNVANQVIAYGSINLQGTIIINKANNGSLRKGAIWVSDSDGDGYPSSSPTTTVSTAQPGGYVRRSTPNTSDCNDGNSNIYQNVSNLVSDADEDGYAASTTGSSACVGNTSSVNGRTYYKDASGTYAYLPFASALNTGTGALSDITTGDTNTCAIFAGGGIQCWGDNHFGQLGNGTVGGGSSTPVSVSGIASATAVATGYDSSCALMSDGTVKCWGYNAWGQLGNGTTTDSSVPVSVSGITSASAIAVNENFACALISGGTIKCWGYNYEGELGNGVMDAGSSTPVSVSGISTATALSQGDGMTTCAVLSGGSVKCWGYGVYGQLGNGASSSSSTPVSVSGISTATKVAVGMYRTCAILSNNTVQCWGNAMLGNGTSSNSSSPVAVSSISTATDLMVTDQASCAVLSSGAVNCWGYNTQGQLANGTFTGSSNTPVAISGISTATNVSGAASTFCSLLSGGTVKCWANNQYAQAGNGAAQFAASPAAVSGISTATLAQTGTGDTNGGSCVRLSNSTVKCWGSGSFGQLGNGSTAQSSTPVAVSGISTATQVSRGFDSACALTGATVQCWGSGSSGQLGNGGTTQSSTPVAVSGISTATQISSGWDFSCARLSNSTVQCWGAGDQGEMGNGTTTATNSTPVTVSGISTATAVSAGGQFACALLSGGTVKCWGYGPLGTLGDGNYSNSSTPVTVSGISTATAISSGTYMACALLTGGSVKCWGANNYGGLGTGVVNNTGYGTPQSVTGISTATAISAGAYGGCALLTGGSVKCWGYNTSGQIGDGTYVDNGTPQSVPGISTATSVSQSSTYTSCAVLSNNTEQCWGFNYYGVLGNGAAVMNSSLVTSNVAATGAGGNDCNDAVVGPCAPASPSATAASSTQINLSWTASTQNPTSYDVYKCTGASCTPTTFVANTASTSYSATSLTASTTYGFKIVPKNSLGDGVSTSAFYGTTNPSCNNVTLLATDVDHDGYYTGSSSTQCVTGPSTINGRSYYSVDSGVTYTRIQTTAALGGSDCYDSNANAFPGQTGWFPANRGDGSNDYDCDGTARIIHTSGILERNSSCVINPDSNVTGTYTYYRCYNGGAPCVCPANLSLVTDWNNNGMSSVSCSGQTWEVFQNVNAKTVYDCQNQTGVDRYN